MSAAGDLFNALLRSDHAEARAEPVDPERQARREKMKGKLRVMAEEGDKDALASLHAMQIADGERRPPRSADGGEGGDRTPPGPTSDEIMNETIREAVMAARARRWSGGGFRDRFIRGGVEGRG